ncbi:unnamed protein product [Prorocentrum cordatum]|uniref:JmjC domain-containing protein n=1 Tax=Prorocentrum cordatum TaxID=2364126 RepID=A0ABN9QU65_9DINO|nr:unnamed protein product [Polarella glacialis]
MKLGHARYLAALLLMSAAGQHHEHEWIEYSKPTRRPMDILTVEDAPQLIQSNTSWNLTQFLKSHGDRIVGTSLVSKLNYQGFPNDGPSMRLKEFVDLDSPKYSVFEEDKLRDAFTFDMPMMPAQLDKLVILSMAKQGSSTPFHTHGAAAFVLVSGSKLWLLTKRIPRAMQNVLGYQTGQALLQHQERFEEWGISVFLQRPGQIVVVPELWYHSTVNIEAAIGVSYQGLFRTSFRRGENEHSCIASFREGDCARFFRLCAKASPYMLPYWEECINSWAESEARRNLRHLGKKLLATPCTDCEYQWTRMAFMWAPFDAKRALSCLKRALKVNPSYIPALVGAFELTKDESFENELKKLHGRFPETPDLREHFRFHANPEL